MVLLVLLGLLVLSTPVLLDDYDEDSEPVYDTRADYVSWYEPEYDTRADYVSWYEPEYGTRADYVSQYEPEYGTRADYVSWYEPEYDTKADFVSWYEPEYDTRVDYDDKNGARKSRDTVSLKGFVFLWKSSPTVFCTILFVYLGINFLNCPTTSTTVYSVYCRQQVVKDGKVTCCLGAQN